MLTLLVFALAPAGGASAHLLDEYLQATLVSIEPGEVRLRVNLTPGVAVADRVVALIDRDRDGSVSADEASAYAEVLKRDLAVRLDRRDLELQLAACACPAPDELRTGSAVIRTEFLVAAPGPLADGPHRLTFDNRHAPSIGAYLVNAIRPRSTSVRITRQTRNDNQSTGEIEFTLGTAGRSPGSASIQAALAVLFAVAICAGALVARRSRHAAAAPREPG